MDHLSVEHLPPAFVEAYAALSPDGRDHFPVVFDKIAPALLVTEAKLSDLAAITAPTLVIAGDEEARLRSTSIRFGDRPVARGSECTAA
jgi:hypothetical protein